MESAHRYALTEYRNLLKRQKDEIEQRLSAINVLLSENTLLNNLDSKVDETDFSKQVNEQWEDYVYRLLQHLQKAKTNDIVKYIKQYNPNIERNEDTLRKTVNRCWRALIDDIKISVVRGDSPSEGNTYYAKNK